MASTIEPMPLHLERGTADDLDQVMNVMDRAFGDRYGEAWTRSQCAGIMPMSGIALTLAREMNSTTVLGFSLMRVVADESELLLLAVDPQHQRRGVGSQLLRDYVARSRDAGARRLHLEVRSGNPAVTMYEASGFAPVGRRKAYYRGKDGGRYDALTYAQDF